MQILEDLHGTVVLTNKEIEAHLRASRWLTVIDKISETFIEEANGDIWSPPKMILPLEWGNDFRIMPSRMNKYKYFVGEKTIGACSENCRRFNLPLAMGDYRLYHAPSMRCLLFFNANLTTAWRTAAASAVAVRELSRKGSNVLGVIGCGQQAYFHIPAIGAVRNITEVLVSDLDKEAIKNIIDKLGHVWNVREVGRQEIFDRSDIVVTLTPTKSPHIFRRDIPQRDLMLCAVGGDSEEKIEFDHKVLDVVDHFCDSYEQVAHTGSVHGYEEEIGKCNLKSLGDLMIGKVALNNKKPVKMYLSTGVALQDLAMALLLWDRVKDIVK